MKIRNIFNGILVKTFFIVLISTLLAVLIKHELLSVSNYMTHDTSVDFKTSDLYSTSLHQSPLHRKCRDVVIVSIDHCDRGSIYQCINKILAYSPAVIAIDVIFEYPHPSDSLFKPIVNDNRLIFANYLIDTDSDADAGHIETSYFNDLFSDNIGAVNLPSTNVIREFKPMFTFQGTHTFNCFAGAVVKLYRPDKYVSLMKNRRDKLTPISYHKVDFDEISSDIILADSNNLESSFKDKIVLVGAMDDPSDKFIAPIDGERPGVLIHANIIDTILNENYIVEIPQILYYFISFLCCFCFILLYFFLKEYIDELSSVVMRITQIVILVSLYSIGVRLYDNNIYLNCLLPMLTITFSTFVSDIWLGFEHLIIKYGKIWVSRLKELL